MWRFFKFLIFSIIIVGLSFGIYKFSNRYDLNAIYKLFSLSKSKETAPPNPFVFIDHSTLSYIRLKIDHKYTHIFNI